MEFKEKIIFILGKNKLLENRAVKMDTGNFLNLLNIYLIIMEFILNKIK